jgi:hypothetical protein
VIRGVDPASQRVSRPMRQKAPGRGATGGGSALQTPCGANRPERKPARARTGPSANRPEREPARELERGATPPLRIVKDRRALRAARARPRPAATTSLQRSVPEIRVEIPMPGPGLAGGGHLRLHPRGGREGAPDVPALGRQRRLPVGHEIGRQAHFAAQAAQTRHGDLVGVDGERAVLPDHAA